MIKFVEETNIFVPYNEEFFKAVFVKLKFCMRVFIVKMKGPTDFVQYDGESLKPRSLKRGSIVYDLQMCYKVCDINSIFSVDKTVILSLFLAW